MSILNFGNLNLESRVHSRDAQFETMPAEIRLHILSFLKFAELKTVVHASPVYHELYTVNRTRILLRSIYSTLGSIAPEVYAIYRTSTKETFLNWDHEKITQLCDDLGKSRVQPESELDGDLDLGDAIAIANFHFMVIQPMTHRYAK